MIKNHCYFRQASALHLQYIQTCIQDATLSQGPPHDAAANFGMHMKFRAASNSFCVRKYVCPQEKLRILSPRITESAVRTPLQARTVARSHLAYKAYL